METALPVTRIVSHDFGIGDGAPASTLRAGSSSIHYWVVPGNR